MDTTKPTSAVMFAIHRMASSFVFGTKSMSSAPASGMNRMSDK
jgi:hypothetical protein